MEDISVQKIAINEIHQLQKIGKQTFFETFSSSNSEANMIKYLQEGFSAAKLLKELENPNSEFYFALSADVVIGYLKINFGTAQTELQNDNALEIERIYVLKDFHGKKVGQILYQKALEVAEHRNAAYIWLGVWEENPRAINFYKKNGFVEFDTHTFTLGDEQQTDILMMLTLH